MDSSICGTFLTRCKIEELIREYGQIELNGHQLVQVDATTGENEGLTSVILRATLKWSLPGNNEILPESVVIKMIIMDKLKEIFKELPKESVDKLTARIRQIHEMECAVYGLAGLSTMVPIPKCYAIKESQPGLIILEDQSRQGMVLPLGTFGRGLNEAQFDQLLDALTSTHAWSLNTNVDWRKSISTIIGGSVISADLATLLLVPSKFQESAKAFPHIFQKLDKSKFMDLLTFDGYMETFGRDPMEKYGLPLVLVHSDLHYMNLIWDRKDGGKEAGDRLLALIDWQCAHQGCGVEDLMRACIRCTSSKFRRDKKDAIIQRYVQLFNSKVTNPKNRIDLEKVEKAFNEMFAYLGALTMNCLGMEVGFTARLKDASEEQRVEVRDMIIPHVLDIFEDASKILGW